MRDLDNIIDRCTNIRCWNCGKLLVDDKGYNVCNYYRYEFYREEEGKKKINSSPDTDFCLCDKCSMEFAIKRI